MKALVFQIQGNKSAIDQDSLFLARSIKMSVERSNDIDAFLSVTDFLDLELASVIEDALD